MNQSEFFQSIEETFSTCLETAKKKNQDYAGDKDPFANFSRVETFGICTVEQGVLVRITDKLARVSNLICSGKNPAVADESVDDTLLDAINYLAILKAYRDSKRSEDISVLKETKNNSHLDNAESYVKHFKAMARE